jgi:hypothetical protein
VAAEEKQEMKTLKVAAHTHARLSLLSSAFGKSITEIIDDLMEVAYPEILEETDKMLDQMAVLRQMAESKKERRNRRDS